MLRNSSFVIAIAVVAFCASSALAVPVVDVDGTIDGDDNYTVVVTDTGDGAGDDFAGSGLDIDTMQFAEGDNSAYLAVTVVGPPFDTDGDDTSFVGETDLIVMFYSDDAGNTRSYHLEVCILGIADIEVSLYDYTTSTYYDSLVEGTDYDIAIGNALELRLADSIFDTGNASYFRAQLDGMGSWDDDQLEGLIPEPATLALLGLGGIGVLLRRRRK